MKGYACFAHYFAAGMVILLAVIFMTACIDSPAPTEVAATIAVPGTPIPVPATRTPTKPASTRTPTTQPPTDTPMPTVNPTLSPTPTVNSTSTPVPATRTPTVQKPTAGSPPAANIELPVPDTIQVYETTITLPTYPIKEYLTEQIDPVYNIPVFYFNRAEYEANAPAPSPVDYTGVVLENPYLRLTFLPELGGRLYSAVIKSTGQELFYHNPVVKPSRYGVLQPYEANWWLATGGMDWAYPTQEHGYRFGVPWSYHINTDANSTSITLSDVAPDRTGLEITVTLPANSATFTVAPKLTNNAPNDVPVQLWVNAALSLTSGSMSPNTQFILPTEVITVHSRGEAGWSVPGEKEQVPWPYADTTDLRHYNQWANYLGLFVPNQVAPFMAAYNPHTNLGIIRLAPLTAAGSHKLFAFGATFPDRSYTDDDSQYFEMWGGANAGFWPEDDIVVPAGQSMGWQESWWPLAGLNGLTWANETLAIHVEQNGNMYALSALMAQPTQGTVQIVAGDSPVLSETFSGHPASPLAWQFSADGGPVIIQFTNNSGALLLEYRLNA